MRPIESPDPLAAFTSDPLAQAAVVLLGKGKWRQARDEAKLLCKKDRNKYLTLLAAANIGLFRDLLSKNLSTDAKTVLENLRTLCPREVVEGLEREMASTQVAQATGGAVLPQSGLNLLWHPLKHFAAESSSTANPENLDWLLVDSVVTAFTPAPVEGEDALGCRLATELAMVHAACRAVSEGHMEEAVNAMRPLPADSVFRHWKFFLRGVRHFISGAKKEAEECFSRLPESGACATAAATILNKPHSVQLPALGKAAWILATVGESPARAREITTADECWKKGNWTGTKDALTRALGKGFSIKQRGIERALSDHLFFFGPEESPVERKRIDQAAQFFVQQRTSSRYATELLFSVSHGMLLGDIDVITDSNLEAEFFDILVLASDFLGQNPMRDSVIYENLGDIFSANCQKPDSVFCDRNRFQPRSAERAIKALTQATECAPNNVFAWVKLLVLNENLGNKSRVHQLLDQLVVRFPQNKKILVKAGALAVERKAFGKGIDYLEAAHQLDPLDSECKAHLIAGLARHVIDRHRRKQGTASLWERMEPLLDSSSHCQDLRQAKWAMDTLRRALEGRADETANCSSLFFELFICHDVGLPTRSTWRRQWLDVSVTGADWIDLFKVFDLSDQSSDFPPWRIRDLMEALLDKMSVREVKKSLETDFPSLLGLARLLLEWFGDEQKAHERFVKECLSKLSQSLRKLLKENLIQNDPRIDFCLSCTDWVSNRKKPAGILEDLKKIDDEAQAKNLGDVRQAVADLRSQIDIKPSIPPPKKTSPRRSLPTLNEPELPKNLNESKQHEFDF